MSVAHTQLGAVLVLAALACDAQAPPPISEPDTPNDVAEPAADVAEDEPPDATAVDDVPHVAAEADEVGEETNGPETVADTEVPDTAPDAPDPDTFDPGPDAAGELILPTRRCGPNGTRCSNCLDDDDDGLTDLEDPGCMSHDDDDEVAFALFDAVPVDRHGLTDCWFDGDIGGDNDGCSIPLACLSDPTDPACQPSGTCVERCLRLTPVGCDCFGCCRLCLDGECATVQLSTAVSPGCTPDSLRDPERCVACVPDERCARPCDPATCIMCPGQRPADLPPACGGTHACPGGLAPCADDADCGDPTDYCHTGCCIGVGLPLVRGPLLEDFETDPVFTRWGGIIWSQLDDVGSTMDLVPWSVGAATPREDTDGLAACVGGVIAREDALDEVFPSVALQLHLDRDARPASIAGFADWGGVELALSSNTPGVEYRLQVVTAHVQDFGYHEVRVRPSSDQWTRARAYFPGTGVAEMLVQPAWAEPVLFDPGAVTGVFIGPVSSAAEPTPYAFCIDDVTFTPPPPVAYSGAITDFERSDTVTELGGTVSTAHDLAGTTLAPHPWTSSSGVTPPGTGNDSARAACIAGRLAAGDQDPYPFAQLTATILPGDAPFDASGYGADPGVSFSLYSPRLGEPVRVLLMQDRLAAPWELLLRMRSAGWQRQTVYFPGVATDRVFVRPDGEDDTPPFDITRLTGIAFSPLASDEDPVDFELCVDELTFATPPAPPPRLEEPPLVTDFESPSVETVWPDGAIFVAVDELGSTLTPNPWTATSATFPGAFGDSDLAACLAGTLAAREAAGDGDGPFVTLALGLTAAGSWVDVTPFAVDGVLSFDLAGRAGVEYFVRVITEDISDFGYYGLAITPSDDGWHRYDAYFVGRGVRGDGSDELTQPVWAEPAAWRPERVNRLEIGPQSRAGEDVPYDFCVDNVRFR